MYVLKQTVKDIIIIAIKYILQINLSWRNYSFFFLIKKKYLRDTDI